MIFQTSDVAALYIALGELEPEQDTLGRAIRRANWIRKVNIIKPMADKLFALVEEKEELFGRKSKEYATKCKYVY